MVGLCKARVVCLCILLAASPLSSNKHADKFQSFADWASSQGVPAHKLIFQDLEQGRGALCGQQVQSGELLLSIPFGMMLSLRSAYESELGDLFKEERLSPTSTLAVHLLWERSRPASFWEEWIKVLPSAEQLHTPIDYTEIEMKELAGSSAYNAIVSRRTALASELKNRLLPLVGGHPNLFPPEGFTQEDFHWAFAVIWSHGFSVPVDGSAVPVLLPVADRLTHDNTPSEIRLDEAKQSFNIFAGSDCEPGNPVYVSYGEKTNAQLLLSYGLVLQDNSFDSVHINTQLSSHDPLHAAKSKILQQHNITCNGTFGIQRGPLSNSLLAALRIQLMQPEEFEHHLNAFKPGAIISLRNELEVFRMLIMACKQMLNAYPTTLEDDDELLSYEQPSRLAAIITMRRGEKAILRGVLSQLQERWSNFLLEDQITWPL